MSLPVSGGELFCWRQKAQEAAIAALIPLAELDWLLQQLGGIDSLTLRLLSAQQNSSIFLNVSLSELSKLWQERLERKTPVQYLAQCAPWRNFLLKVSPFVLIPRPETELIIDIAQKKIAQNPSLSEGNWVDLGTGSGAIAVGLAELLPKAAIHAVDCSEQALKIAQENAANLGFKERIAFYQGNWWEPLKDLQGKVAGMVSNPPYIPTDVIPSLQPEVVNHEPYQSLDGGADGLGAIRHLVETGCEYVHGGGIWLIEMMAGQRDDVVKLLQQQGGYEKIEIIPDLGGIDRFVCASII